MKKYIYVVAICGMTATLVSCGSNSKKGSTDSRDSLIACVKAIEGKLKTMPTLDAYNGNLAITAYSKFAEKFPDDSLSPAFIFQAAQIEMTIGQYEKALSLYQSLCAKYPNSKYVPNSTFIEGFIYDNNLKDTAKAHAKYQEVITKFPNHELAPQAKAAIAVLGKSDEELIKEFQEKNKDKK